MNPFTDHPASVGETYWEHLRFAARFGAKMTAGGLSAMVHSVFPFSFTTTASRIHDDLSAMLAETRARAATKRVARAKPLDDTARPQ